jgi:hypothetical protein
MHAKKVLVEKTGQSENEPKKVSLWYVKVSESQDTVIYAISIFGSVIYVKVRVKEKPTKNIFVWLLDPTIEKVGLSLQEVS